MNYHKIEKTSIANGPGVRCVLWVSGCSLHCKGCHNPETWDLNSGQPFNKEARQELFDILSKPWIQGITFSGGHPLEYNNLPYVFGLVTQIKMEYPTKDIWLYTGFSLTRDDFSINRNRFNKLQHGHYLSEILSRCDVIVDGPYIESQRDITLPFRGSKNQRIIDVKKTLQQNEVVLLDI